MSEHKTFEQHYTEGCHRSWEDCREETLRNNYEKLLALKGELVKALEKVQSSTLTENELDDLLRRAKNLKGE